MFINFRVGHEIIIKFHNSINMYSAQKKKKYFTSCSHAFQGFPRLIQRVTNKPQIQNTLSSNAGVPLKQNIIFGFDELKFDEISKQQSKVKLNRQKFYFLTKNSNLMNKSISIFTQRIQDKNAKKLNKILNHKFNSNQIKYGKSRKQEWMENSSNFCYPYFEKNKDQEERQMYKSRKKNLQNTVQTFVAYQYKNQCLSGIFPIARINATLMSVVDKQLIKQRIFLFGGISPQMNTKFHFHEFSNENNKWNEIKTQPANRPQFNLSQHLCLCYKNCVYIFGGIVVIPSKIESKNQRYNIPFISSFNMKTLKWSRISWSIYLRALSGASFGQYALIDGGITEQQKTNYKMYAFDMSKTSVPFIVNNNSLGLHHHKIVSTQGFEDKSRSFIKIEGFICFGGKKQNGQVNKSVYIMSYDSKQSQFVDRMGNFQWEQTSFLGRAPQGRYMHSMDILQTKSCIFQRKAYCAIIGGIGEKENILNDFWLLDIGNLQWIQISLYQTQCKLLQKGIAGHCTTSNQNQIYIFGGYNSQRQQVSKFWTIICQNGFKTNKNGAKLNQSANQKYLSTSFFLNQI